ncbi:TraB/GumN family protein [Desulfovermiculus halophilus]|uniref:TraB/GumN family protein n=1 Tax=Desulfovermiculus halophilus TaxID=339722 RepID=UPI0006868184|nr:TraB/GumN family protein [Desulfovermiculus halophilus]
MTDTTTDSKIQTALPPSVTTVRLEDKTVHIVGTAHVSHASVRDVETAISQIRPETVCVELCPSRHQAMTRPDDWKNMDLFKVVKEKKALFLLLQLILSGFYRSIAKQLGIQPGAEMLAAVTQAREQGANLVLADRDVNITLKRVWGYLPWWQKLKMLFHLVGTLIVPDKVDESSIEELKDKDQLEVVMDQVARAYPQVKKRLIDERDLYLAHAIQNAPGRVVVAVVGAGHVPGIVKALPSQIDPAPLQELPPPAKWPRVLKWLIPAIILGLLVYGFIQGPEQSIQSVSIWVLVNGIFSALAVALALAHPITIVSTFVAAPLTSLNPTVAAGWVAGLVQAWVKKPTVADLEGLPGALGSVRSFWLNPVCRILLVVVLANLGSSLGTFVAGGWIASRLF